MQRIKPVELVRWLLHPSSRLSQRVAQAGFWAFTLRVMLRLFTVVRTIILARLLAPEDFGLMGIALIMMSMLEASTQTGFRSALVQRKGDIREFLNVAWTIELLRALVLSVALVLAAPVIANFFDTPAVTPVVRVMAIVIFIHGLNNIGIVYFQKELELHKRFIYQIVQTIAEVAVGIGLALALQNVWALVYGSLAGAVVRVVASYILHSHRPRLRFQMAEARELFRFGKWVFGSQMLNYLMDNLVALFVGKIVGVANLGLFRIANNLSQMISLEMVNIIDYVAFPTFAKLQDSPDRLRAAYLETIQLAGFVAFPVAVATFVIAPDAVQVILGQRWLPMVPALQVLAIWGLIRSLTGSREPIFKAIGRPDVHTKLLFATFVMVCGLIYPMTALWGMFGASLAITLSGAAVYPVGVWLVTKAVGCPVTAYLKVFIAPILCSTIMAGVLLSVEGTLVTQPSVTGIATMIGFGVMADLGTSIIMIRFFNYGIGATLRRMVPARVY